MEMSNDGRTREVFLKWEVVRHPFGMWRVFSMEQGTHELTGGDWKWKSLTHQGQTWEGTIFGASLNLNLMSAIPTIGIYNAMMAVNIELQWSAICRGTPITAQSSASGSRAFHVNDK